MSDTYFADVFTSGGRDGCIMVWDTRSASQIGFDRNAFHTPVITISDAHKDKYYKSAECAPNSCHRTSSASTSDSSSPRVRTTAGSRRRARGHRTRHSIGTSSLSGVTNVSFMRDDDVIASCGASDGYEQICGHSNGGRGAQLISG
jgi:WD40 repeat protein